MKTVDTSFGGGNNGAKYRISGLFWGSNHFSAGQHLPAPTNHTKLSEKVYLGVLQHPTKFQAKIDRKNLFVKKIKIFTRWLRILGVYFGHNSPTP